MASLARGNPRGGSRGRASQNGQFSGRGFGGTNNSTTSPFQKPTGGRGQGLGGRGASQAAPNQSLRKSKLSVVQNAKGNWMERYTALQDSRKKEREDAIRQGLMADPDKPTTLAEAITLVGTCQDMCAEFERVERVVQKDVWKEEVDPSRTAVNPLDREPDETRMVKKFRRAAAGIEEQLPSDLRPPTVLQQTCNYLFNDIVGAAETLASVHHFVWDRTRAIRNDFSIQQLTRPEDLAIAVNCYEQIARFHILSLHQLALAEKPYEKYDWQQEREQLDRTLLSLIQYYDDSRGKINLVNEPEFRAYCVIFQLRNPDPDLEEKVQTWPRHIAKNQRVRSALKLYAAACNTRDDFGPLKPAVPHATAQQDWHRVWQLIESKEISYLTACVAEIHFNMVRENVLHALLRSTSIKSMVQWTIEELRIMLAFDTEDGILEFCARYDLSFIARDGVLYLDFSELKNKQLPAANANAAKQLKTGIVEQKRAGRSLPAVISGLTFRQALERGMVNHEEDSDVDGAMHDHDMDAAQDSDDGLFVSESKPANAISAFAGFVTQNASQANKPAAIFTPPAASDTPTSVFGKPSKAMDPTANSFAPKFSFGKPSTDQVTSLFSTASDTTSTSKSTFGQPSAGTTTQSNTATSILAGAQTAAAKPPLFDFKAGLNKAKDTTSNASPSPFAGFVKPATPMTSQSTAAATTDKASSANESLFSFLNKPASSASGDAVARSKSLFSQPLSGDLKDPSKIDTNSANASKPPSSSLFDFAKSAAPSTTTGLFSRAAPANDGSVTKEQSKPATTSPFDPSSSTTKTSSSLPQPNTSSLFTFPAAPTAPPPATPMTPVELSTGSTDTSSAKQSLAFPAASVSPKSFPPATQVKQVQQSTEKHVSKPAPVLDLNSIVTRLAEELSYEPQSGFFKQYIDFALGQIVSEAQEKVYNERLEQDAKLFRAHVLTLRYGRRWRELYRAKKLAKHARDRRARAMKRLNEHRSQTSAASSTVGDGSMLGEERPRRPAPSTSTAAKRAAMDKLFQKTSGQWAKEAAEKASPNDSRSPSVVSKTSHDGAQQRQSTKVSRIDRSGKVVKPSPLRASQGSISEISSFSPARSTTKSSYFRLKALGMDKIDQSIAKSRKRGYSELSSGASDQSWTSPSNALVLPGNIVTPSETPEERDAKMLKLHDEEDELFARLRAARANLEEGMSFYKAEVAKSLSPQTEPVATGHYDSPSLQRARQEARWRHENKKLPAYMLRESKFVRPTLPSASHTPRSAPRSHAGTPGAQPEQESPTYASGAGFDRPASVTQATMNSHTLAADESQTVIADSYTNGDHHPSQEHPDLSTQSVDAHMDESADVASSHVPFNAEVHDYTIKQSQIPDILNASFGPPSGHEDLSDHHHSFGDSTWNGDAAVMPDTDMPQSELEEPMQHIEESYADGDMFPHGYSAAPYGVASQNPFAALGKQLQGQDYEDDELVDEHEGHDYANGHLNEGEYGKLYDEEDADVSDDEEDEGPDPASQEYGYDDEGQYDEGDEDEDDLDSEEEESDVDAPPAANEALKTIGHTEDEAIELSD